MNIEDLTIKQVREVAAMVGGSCGQSDGINHGIGKKVIIRTYSAGVWFGTLSQKAGNEVVLTDARRMWKWHAAKSISLSGCAKYGVNESHSKIVEAINSVWLEAIEIMPCTDKAICSIEGCASVEAN